ncbi:unnamed protein product [Gordionus sp. m RMFG-2023]|uniref:uncharacterized protein LOC135922339 n=1 Tax=Gordionus sp. m RMFG-2023 TaxID=3053472 RepID=UPI0030DEAC34
MLEPEEVIWNQAHPDHKKTFSVMEKLSIIGIKLSEEFPDYDCSVNYLRKRLRNFKDQLNKDKLARHSGSRGGVHEYKYKKYINFMQATVADRPTVSNFQESPPQTRNPAKNQNDLQKLMSVLEKTSSSIQIFLDSLVDVLEGYDSDEDYFFKTEVLKTMQIIKINRRNTQTTETSETALDIFNTI